MLLMGPRRWHFKTPATAGVLPETAVKHSGDFGNIVADKKGSVDFKYIDKSASLEDPKFYKELS